MVAARRFRAGRALFWAALAAVVFAILFPFYWMITSSMKNLIELFGRTPVFFPSRIHVDAYRILFGEMDFARNLANTAVVAPVTALLAIVAATMGSYAVARLRFPGKALFLNLVLVVYLFPGVLLIIPLFAMMVKVGGAFGVEVQDNLAVLVLTYMAQTLPVALYMLSGYFRTIPDEIEQAGLIDGCSRTQVILRITIPLSVPALVSVTIYTFMIAWNEFLYAFVFLNRRENFTLPIKLLSISEQLNTRWDVVMAASTIMTIPIVVLFLAAERFLEKGLVAGGVKG
jgi:multiple sugar transport system permease protein